MPDDKPKLTREAVVGYVLATLGVIMVALGLAWPQLVPDELYWSEADAKEWTEASKQVHAARSKPRDRMGKADDELAAATQRLAIAEQRLERARRLRNNTGRVLSISGACVALMGVLLIRSFS